MEWSDGIEWNDGSRIKGFNRYAFYTARIINKLTQKELANITGTTQGTISKIEKGIIKNPDKDLLLKIADATEMDIRFFYDKKYYLLKSEEPIICNLKNHC